MISAMILCAMLGSPCDGGKCTHAILPRHVISVKVDVVKDSRQEVGTKGREVTRHAVWSVRKPAAAAKRVVVRVRERKIAE